MHHIQLHNHKKQRIWLQGQIKFSYIHCMKILHICTTVQYFNINVTTQCQLTLNNSPSNITRSCLNQWLASNTTLRYQTQTEVIQILQLDEYTFWHYRHREKRFLFCFIFKFCESDTILEKFRKAQQFFQCLNQILVTC